MKRNAVFISKPRDYRLAITKMLRVFKRSDHYTSMSVAERKGFTDKVNEIIILIG
jgi:hypothetical protein